MCGAGGVGCYSQMGNESVAIAFEIVRCCSWYSRGIAFGQVVVDGFNLLAIGICNKGSKVISA